MTPQDPALPLGVLGGIGRLLSALQFGMGPPLLAAFIVIELVGPVAVLVWRRRLVNSCSINCQTARSA